MTKVDTVVSVEKVQDKIQKEAKKAKRKFEIIEIVKCGQYSPGKFRICADFVMLD